MTIETTATAEPTVTVIDVTMDPQSLIGDGTTWETEGYDEDSSIARYAAILTTVLRKEYPQAAVSVWWAYTDQTKIAIETDPDWTTLPLSNDGYRVEDTQEHIQSVYEAVFEGRHGDWAVEAAR